MAHNIVRLDRFATTLGHAGKLDEYEIAILPRAAFDRHKSGGAIAHLLDNFVDLRLAGLDGVNLHIQVFVITKFKLRQHFEYGPELKWLAFLELDLVDLGPGHRHELLFIEGLLQVFRNERLQNFTLYIVSKAPANQGDGSFSGTKSGNTRHAC